MKRGIFAILNAFLSMGIMSYADDLKTIPERDIGVPDNYYEALSQINPDGFENEIIDYYKENRINLKTTNAGYLSQIPSIDYLTALQIIDLVQLAGIKDYDLLTDSLRLSDYQADLLKLCTVLDDSYNPEKFNINLRTRCLVPLTESRGFSENIYKGDRYNFYQRMTVKSNDIRGGIIIDKDRGEASYTDYLTAYLGYNSRNFSVIAGDYYIESGLGSTLWTPYGLRKSAEVSSVFRQWGTGIKPNVYSSENHFFRGICTSFQINLNKSLNLNIIGWYSNKNRSGTIDSSNGLITSLKDDGYYKTDEDESKKNNINELNAGTCIMLNNSYYMIGISGYYIEFDKYIQTESSTTMVGKKGIFASLFGNINIGSHKFIFELSRDNRSYLALKTGLLFTRADVKYGLFYRYFPDEFRSPYGYNFGQASSPSNESGLYSFLELKLNKSISFSTFIDFYRTLSKSYTYPGVGRGIELLTELNYRINSLNLITFRLKYENGQVIGNTGNYGRRFGLFDLYSFRAELRTMMNSSLSSRIRIEGTLSDIEDMVDETGLAIQWELGYQPTDKLSLNFGLSYFSTDSYNSAIWTYEYNFPGYFYSVALYGNGLRYDIGLSYHPVDLLSIWVKYLINAKNNTDALGSGWDETMGNEQKGLQLQIDINW